MPQAGRLAGLLEAHRSLHRSDNGNLQNDGDVMARGKGTLPEFSTDISPRIALPPSPPEPVNIRVAYDQGGGHLNLIGAGEVCFCMGYLRIYLP
jgi:hypothetical protein